MPVEDLSEAPVDLGDFLEVTLRSRQDDGMWHVTWDEAPPGWKLFASERDASGWQPGAKLRLRVFRLDRPWRKAWLTVSDFGFMPVQDKMRQRYLQAINVVSAFVETGKAADRAALLDQLSEAKGIVNRCVRQDQCDWFAVWCGLGRPDREELQPVAVALAGLRQGLRDGDEGFAERMCQELMQRDLPSMLRELGKHLGGG